MTDEAQIVCAECGKVVEDKDMIYGPHPMGGYVDVCHRACWPGSFRCETTTDPER